MIQHLFSFIAPHYCCGCGKIGTVICDNCKYDITIEKYSRCLQCHKAVNSSGTCLRCATSYDRAWCVGGRSDTLKRIIDIYKFERVKAAAVPIAELLLSSIDRLPKETIVVPVPTIDKHIRQRGYDHAALLSKYVAKGQQLQVATHLSRQHHSVQRGVGRRKRLAQAKSAFICRTSLDPAIPYLLIDDIVTTGATIEYACRALRAAGARIVWVAVVAHQPLDE